MDSSCTVTVHSFCENLNASQLNTESKFDEGNSLAKAACSSLGWITQRCKFDASIFLSARGQMYVFATKPPRLPSSNSIRKELKEWGEPLDPVHDDYFLLGHLDEFESTEFNDALESHYLNVKLCTTLVHSEPPVAELSPPVQVPQRRAALDSLSLFPLQPPAKRPRIDLSSLLNVIPQPHFLPAPSAGFLPLDPQRITPFLKAEPCPIAPHTLPSIQQLLMSPYQRGSWIIPIRGNLPWAGSTCASILEPIPEAAGTVESVLPSGPTNQRERQDPPQITWTYESLLGFWKFLASIQQAKTLGPISLSFHSASSRINPSTQNTFEPISEDVNRYSYPDTKPSVQSDSLTVAVGRARLQTIDHIKVYHDAKYSMYIRNILDAYQFIHHSGENTTQNKPEKIRVLKGARLIFMDDCSNAAFLL
ncbi:hypothetical protein BJ138DRAFT_1161059 [Hygrophoropsis aurantiaca]|uniref:Uncharacterized protein n=1 Tax=Hygrophoropsis aurantiaca TaxID=72124 RepID=A0ACB8A133_9AGAM|nr:hypothetical protein BJ138DRAFT_1161059 [Hygrophoropsis aurantiaca]